MLPCLFVSRAMWPAILRHSLSQISSIIGFHYDKCNLHEILSNEVSSHWRTCPVQLELVSPWWCERVREWVSVSEPSEWNKCHIIFLQTFFKSRIFDKCGEVGAFAVNPSGESWTALQTGLCLLSLEIWRTEQHNVFHQDSLADWALSQNWLPVCVMCLPVFVLYYLELRWWKVRSRVQNPGHNEMREKLK